ncbi:MAG TPA: bifunctional enoyl-CoA hydratase/phosphate acetyltransferase [Bacteroidales bacterium]|nr:bifunctional enoyl-CoA hydratase/phosphate acetyltransferase [Bacteroidales bacterium]HSA42157.1 bifunctional enoyl-CoA hydratase/phosphate acetyltransferase [Bacteroidales bacterium]
MPITRLNQMFEALKAKPRKRLIAAYANDSHTIEAVYEAVKHGLIDGTLVGDTDTIHKVCGEHSIDVNLFRIVHEPQEVKATQLAVALINQGEGEILMKGLVSTDRYMRAILDKEKGLMDPGAILTHVTVIENPAYPKLIVCGDVAIIPAPDLKQKIALCNFLIQTAHALGIEQPKVAVIAATEQMLAGMPACVDAAILAKMNDRGQIKGGLVDGPLAVDVAVDRESVEIKKLVSPVAGDADCLLFPNIEAGNVFYKTSTKLANSELGALVFGARVPAVLSSRGDSMLTKLYSIALAALVSK